MPRVRLTDRCPWAAVTKVVSTEAAMNREAIKEAKWFRDAFIEQRDETRRR
jgi:hypothetical protein